MHFVIQKNVIMECSVRFIEIIKKHSAIYDKTDKGYKKMDKKKEAWLSVSKEAGLSVDACKRKWKNLRESYTKYLRSHRPNTKSSKKYQYWVHAENMKFLRPYQGPMRSFINSNNKNDEIHEQNDESISSAKNESNPYMRNDESNLYMRNEKTNTFNLDYEMTEPLSPQPDDPIAIETNINLPSLSNSPTPTSQTNFEKNLLKQIELDSTNLFFLSLAKSVKSMPKKYQVDIKMKFMQIVNDAELSLESSNSLNRRNISKPAGQERVPSSSLSSQQYQQQQKQQLMYQQQQQNQTDNSEHFLYVMSPSRVVDISSDDEYD